MSGGAPIQRPVIRARILGCGSSGGVPRIDGDWGRCDPSEPKNFRYRCSLLIEHADSLETLAAGIATRVLVDTSPDLRVQMLAAGVRTLDGVVFTHTHADQSHGVDDVRAIVYARGARLPAVMSPETRRDLLRRFEYIFETPPGSDYPPFLTAEAVASGAEAVIDGPGGPVRVSLFDVDHGGAACSGVRCGPLVYTPDVNGLNAAAWTQINGCSLWILDALRERPHPSHAHLALALDWLHQAQPALGVLTNLHVDMDYGALIAALPAGVRPAFDGLAITLDAESGQILHADPA